MDELSELKDIINGYDDYYRSNGATEELVECYSQACIVAFNNGWIEYGLELTKKAKEYADEAFRNAGFEDFFDVDYTCNATGQNAKTLDWYYTLLKLEAPFLFDSYMLYLEKNRPNDRRFYANRAKTFRKLGIIQAMQDLEDDKLDILSISLPPSTGKTTTEVFFASWVCGRHIEDYSLFFTHSAEMADIFYRGVLDIVQSDEYLFHDIFPNCTLNGTDAKAKKINFGGYKPYYNIQCTSVGAQNAGKVRANRYLYCDDMISSIEEALNKSQLEKIWRIYTSDARQRKKNQQVKEIHIATRWSVHDCIGRLQEIYKDDARARFIAVPDIDPVTGESNFNYRHEGMTTEFFNDIALTMDDITYQCLYKNEPIEREGLLYHEEELRRYDRMPEREPDAILSICDTKTTGIDYMFLPVCYKYDDDYYCEDCICDDSTDFEYQYTRLTNILLDHKVQQCEIESNAGGSRIAFEVRKRIDDQGGRCNVTEKPTETNKETRIIVNSDWIKRHVLFKIQERYTPKSDYGRMMNFLLSYSVVGKNKNDDVPDGWANFALFVNDRKIHRRAKIIRSPF